jgi:UDP-glucose 4-epimerase
MNLQRELCDKFPKIAVIGGAGFIGSHIVDELLLSGCNVTVIDDFSSGKIDNLKFANSFADRFSYFDFDVTQNFNDLTEMLAGVDLVINQSASKMNVCLRNPRRDLQVNAEGALNLLLAAEESGCKRFLHASTGSVYGSAVVFPTNENHPLNPVSYYGVSKLAGEKYVRLFNDSSDMNTSILRYFHVYGPRQESNDLGGVVAIFIRNILKKEPIRIFGDGSQIRSFTFVEDIVKINLFAALRDDLGGIAINCASGIKVTILELATSVIELMGVSDYPIIYEKPREGDIYKFDVDNGLAKSLIGDFVLDFKAGLSKTIDFFISSGSL